MNGMCACAFYLGRGMSWTSANSTCRSLGARLPEIMNLQENVDIYKLMVCSQFKNQFLFFSDLTFKERSI